MKKIFWLFCICLSLFACSQSNGNDSKLIAGKWIVDDAILEVKDAFFAGDSVFKKKIEDGYEQREYVFDKDGKFSISQAGTTLRGEWNFVKNDTDLLYRNMGVKTNGVVMRNKDGFLEVWMPWTNKQSIFTDYFGEERIQVLLLPADDDGNLHLTLKKNQAK